MTAPVTNTPQKRRGGWQRGVSGNPAGRKPGSGRIAKLRAEIADEMPAIIATLIVAAKGGDVQAAKVLLSRSIAELRPVETPAPFRLPAGTLSEKADAVLAAIGSGDLAPAQGSQLIGALAAAAKVIEVDDVLRRIAAMEANFAAD